MSSAFDDMKAFDDRKNSLRVHAYLKIKECMRLDPPKYLTVAQAEEMVKRELQNDLDLIKNDIEANRSESVAQECFVEMMEMLIEKYS